MVVVFEFVDDGDLVILRGEIKGVRVFIGLGEIVVVSAEAHCTRESVAGFKILTRDQRGVGWSCDGERKEAEQ